MAVVPGLHRALIQATGCKSFHNRVIPHQLFTISQGIMGVNGNGSNRPPVPWVESSPFRNWVEWTWVDLEKCQVQGRQHIDFDPSPFDPIRPQSIRPKLFDQKGRPNSFRPISFDPFHAIRIVVTLSGRLPGYQSLGLIPFGLIFSSSHMAQKF